MELIDLQGYVIQDEGSKLFYSENINGDWCFDEIRAASVFQTKDEALSIADDAIINSRYHAIELKMSIQYELSELRTK